MSEEAAVAAPEEVLVPPEPIHDEPHPEAGDKPEPVKAKEPPAEKPLTARQALEKAAATVDKEAPIKDAKTVDPKADPKAAKVEDKAVDKSEKARDPATGKFATPAKVEGEPDKETEETKAAVADAEKTAPHRQPPARFSADAKAEWDKLPEPVKAETHRAIRELEQGFTKHKESATAYDTIFKPFHDLAKQTGSDPSKALNEYVGIDRLLSQNFTAGMERIAANKGIDLRAFAAHVLGQQATPQDQQQQQTVQLVRGLNAKIAQLEQQVNGVTRHAQSQEENAILSEVEAFAKNPEYPHFEELSDQIAQHIANDGLSLPDAYAKAFDNAQSLARRLGFSPEVKQPPKTDVADLAAQTLKGRKSIAGAPSAGSAPAAHKPSSSIKDALKRAIATASV